MCVQSFEVSSAPTNWCLEFKKSLIANSALYWMWKKSLNAAHAETAGTCRDPSFFALPHLFTPPFPLIGQQPPRCLPSCNLETSIPASPFPTFNPSILFTSNPSIPKFPCFGDRSALKFNFSISWEPDKQPLKSQDFRCLDSIKTLEKKRRKKKQRKLWKGKTAWCLFHLWKNQF